VEKIRIYQINASESGVELIKQYVSKNNVLRLLDSTTSHVFALEEIPRYFPDIILIDEAAFDIELSEYVQKLILRAPYAAIVVMTSSYSTNMAKNLMNVGVRDILNKPFSSDDLVESIIKVHKFNQEIKQYIAKNGTKMLTTAPKMVTVFSTKGGVGKSVLSTLIASGLATFLKEDTAIVDLDLQFGDVSLLLDIKPKATITTAIEKIDELSSIELKKILSKHSMGMYVLPSPLNPEEEEFITSEALVALFKKLKQEFDYIIIDSPPGFTDQVIVALEQSDIILFITSPEISALKNTQNGLKTLRQLEIDMSKVKIIVNRYTTKTKINLATIEDVLNMPVYTTIADDYENIIQFLNLGEPKIIYESRNKIAKDLRKLIEELRTYLFIAKAKTSRWKWLKKWFRLF
jgi:pilus assembly protein CpaE